MAGLDHLVTFTLPIFLCEACNVGGLDDVNEFGGLPLRIEHARACKIVARSAAHCLSSGNGKRMARNPQAVRTSWLPSCMWQVWQVGAAAVPGNTCICLSSFRTPCFEAEYISHCG